MNINIPHKNNIVYNKPKIKPSTETRQNKKNILCKVNLIKYDNTKLTLKLRGNETRNLPQSGWYPQTETCFHDMRTNVKVKLNGRCF